MALGAAPTRARPHSACLYALLCLCAVAQPQGGGPGEQPPPGQQQRPRPGEGPMPAWVFFVNIDDKPMDVYFVGQVGGPSQRQQVGGQDEGPARVLEPGQLTRVSTFVGHAFEVEQSAAVNPKRAAPAKVDIKLVEEDTIHKLWVCERKQEGSGAEVQASIHCRPEKLEYKGEMWDQHVDHMRKVCNQIYQKHPEDAAFFCNPDYTDFSMAQCIFDTSEEEFLHIYENKQKVNNDGVLADHSHVTHYTKTGHKVDQIPAELFGKLQKHWQEDRLTLPRPENMDRFSAVVPGCRSDSWIMRMGVASSPELRQEVIDTVQAKVAAWAGLKTEDLEHTALYGLRHYRNGMWFPLHRDKPQTHVLSAILEIGQLDLDHPDPNVNGTADWPLHIHDHAGKIQTIPYKPGQLIFYESFACPHGRPNPMQGREIASLFVHFAPKNWGDKDWDLRTQQQEKKKAEL